MLDREYTKEEVAVLEEHYVSTRSERLRQAMYPETMVGGENMAPSTQFDNQQTAVQKLTQPSRTLKEAVVNLINFQDDADSAAKVLPELTSILLGPNEEDAEKAVEMIQMLSKKHASRQALLKNADLVKH